MTHFIDIPLEVLQAKSQFLHTIRQFFYDRGVMEVTTPILSQYGNTDVFIESVSANVQRFGAPSLGFLHTSPEFAMKKLLSRHPVPIYQICQVFRDNEIGRRHNIEFSMLEWYRPNYSLMALQNELNELMNVLFGYPVVVQNISYAQAFLDVLGVHPFGAPLDELQRLADSHHLPKMDSRQGLLDALFSHLIEPALGKSMPTIVTDYPPATAALAKIETDKDGYEVAKRFELYIHGLEIANAYDELSDKRVLAERFIHDNAMRQDKGLPVVPIDADLLEAMDTLPPCSGIAVGIDRLLMAIHKFDNIHDVLILNSTRA